MATQLSSPCLSSRLRQFLLSIAGRASSSPIPSPLFRSYVHIFRSMVNTRGFALLVFLYLLRFHSFYIAARNFGISTLATLAITANFNLDLDASTRRRTITPAVSRIILFSIFYSIYRKASRQNAPLYVGLALRFVPTAMFFLFKGIYLALRYHLRRAARLLPGSPMSIASIDNTAQCCVCLEQACNYRTTCGHCFHQNCISDWLEVKSRCPICQGPLRPPNEALRNLRQYFILDYGEWIGAHNMFFGGWISEPILQT